MFSISDPDHLVLSAGDLTSHLACDHLVEQLRAVALGERSRWRPAHDPHKDEAFGRQWPLFRAA